MGVATTPPQRHDLSLFTDDDRTIGAKWVASDGTTLITIASAVLTLLFDQPPTEWIDGEPQPLPPEVRHTVDSTTPEDPNGWIDLSTAGVAMATLPATMWAPLFDQTEQRAGIWDLVANSSTGTQRCLLRGEFAVEIGVMA